VTPSPFLAQALSSLSVAHALHRVARFYDTGRLPVAVARVAAMRGGVEQLLEGADDLTRLRVRAHLERERQA
jgi:hypothetical protein